MVWIAWCIRAVLVCSVRCLDSRAIRAGVRVRCVGRILSVARWSVSPSAALRPEQRNAADSRTSRSFLESLYREPLIAIVLQRICALARFNQMTHGAVSAIVEVLGPVYLCSFAANMVAQVFAVGFAVACAIALCRPTPYCLVGRHLALWSLYSALAALAMPVSVGLVILCLRLLQPSEKLVEIMRGAGYLVYEAARFTSPAISVVVLLSFEKVSESFPAGRPISHACHSANNKSSGKHAG